MFLAVLGLCGGAWAQHSVHSEIPKHSTGQNCTANVHCLAGVRWLTCILSGNPGLNPISSGGRSRPETQTSDSDPLPQPTDLLPQHSRHSLRAPGAHVGPASLSAWTGTGELGVAPGTIPAQL